MYQHLASCNRCIEFLAMFLQLSEVADNEAEAQARWQLEAADPELRNLTDMVLALLDQDEINFGNSSA
ncbi:MAG: hypothetical protein HY231_09150 [Acidobacteria bacterium]|nr:hypothetical protein [Acidobacteriota bacterium]